MGSHSHDHHPPSSGRTLLFALLITFAFAALELFGGLLSGSLALLGDAGHMLTDGLSLGLAAVAAWLAARPASHRHSYGLGRVELLAALLNALFMIGIVATISVAAINRFMTPQPVTGEVVTVVAVLGLLANLLVGWLLTRQHANLNIRGALLHVIGDLLGSVAALIAGLVISFTGWTPIDPLLSLLIAGLILFSALHLLRETLHLLLDGVPVHLNLQEVGQALANSEGVVSVHDLHIWQFSGEEVALSAHLRIQRLERWPQQLIALHRMLERDFGIRHVTLQPEPALDGDDLHPIGEPDVFPNHSANP